MTQLNQVFLGLGSNIDPRWNLLRCLDLLERIPGAVLEDESSWYRTRPWGVEDQAEFVNLVVGMRTALEPMELLRATQAIEVELGRKRLLRNGPRTIDIDLLLFGDRVLAEPDLSLPHPGLTERDFMLIPLIEIAPETLHPVVGRPVAELQGLLRYRQILSCAQSAPRPGTA
ncbi:MAG: 2-amino-4-hydroxy-6-hydroxymethyldihydropteridine diphosphokinase [Thiohalocapsa sp.]|nr:2-amino-4-hydroxy-6-hydroxymethyldihydropteridine diphosphokinase [Thiohalocapsa sp.]